jgi:hypothetical protein
MLSMLSFTMLASAAKQRRIPENKAEWQPESSPKKTRGTKEWLVALIMSVIDSIVQRPKTVTSQTTTRNVQNTPT